MIGSFWNLCRACPSMPLDKLHSEYRSTYRWHEYTGNSRPEVVVRRPPVSNASNGDNFFSRSTDEEKQGEPPLPRRKKCPELAYRAHEFIGASGDVTDSRIGTDRARSGDRGTPSRRSKSAGPPSAFRQSSPPPAPHRAKRAAPVNGFGGGPHKDNVGQSTGESGLFRKTISKLSTEYRLQFVWPQCRKAVSEAENLSLKHSQGVAGTAAASSSADVVDSPKKSKSMGALKSGGHQQDKSNLPMVHRKRTTCFKEATSNELEPLFGGSHGDEKIDSLEQKMGHKKMFNGGEVNQRRSDKQNFGFGSNGQVVNVTTSMGNSSGILTNSWYKDVIELRKKAGEYKCRGWGAEIDPDYHRKQKDLWDQVSRRSSLSALSLATTAVRPITKEEKEKANSKKSTSPTKGISRRPGGEMFQVDNKHPDAAALKLRKEAVRHHLDRTTGSIVEDGALLPSPTIDKLMPALPRSREGSPKKTIASRHGSPQKGSPKKLTKMSHKGRSQSVGANHVADVTTNGTTTNGSPKRQLRSAVTIEDVKDGGGGGMKPVNKDTKVTITAPGERRPRPTTLSTTPKNATRSKSSSLPPSSLRAQSVPAPQSSSSSSSAAKQPRESSATRPKSYIGVGRPIDPMTQSIFVPNDRSAKGPKWSGLSTSSSRANGADGGEVDGNGPQQALLDALLEPIVKSPPEPTRVKSPEQLLMRSPDPVNWTVPLDTGKTFTVTQNIREGDLRPHSEMKISTPITEQLPLPSASAPPELAEQAKLDAYNRPKSNPTDVTKIVQPLSPKKTLTNAAAAAAAASSSVSPVPVGVVATSVVQEEKPKEAVVDVTKKGEDRFDKPVPGSTLRCLEDPIFTADPVASKINTSNESEARDRFDRFWGGKEAATVNGEEPFKPGPN